MADKLMFRPADKNKKYFEPIRHHEGDAGYDLTAIGMTSVHPKCFAQVPTNLIVQPPPGTWALITGRSSTFFKMNLIVNPGIIDNGWRGELLATVFNPTDRIINVMLGQRVCQLILMRLIVPPAVHSEPEDMDAGDRGTNGFGSTGTGLVIPL